MLPEPNDRPLASIRLPWWMKAGYGVGDLGINIFLVSTGMFLLYFLTDTLRINPAVAGIAISVPRIWDVIADPIMGTISDRTRSSLGRRRPYLIGGAFAFSLTFALMFWLPHASTAFSGAIAMCLLYAIACTGFTVFFIPYASMTAEMTDDYNERTSLTSFRMSFAVVGGLVGGGATLELVKLGGGGTIGFRNMGLVFAAIMCATSLIAFFATSKARRTDPGSQEMGLSEQLKAVKDNRPFVILMFTFLVQSVAVGVLMAALIYFLKHVMHQPDTAMGGVFGVFYGCIVISMPLWVLISKKLGKKSAYAFGVALFAVALFGMLVVGEGGLPLFFVLIGGCGVGCGAFYLFPFSMLPDTIDFDEMRTGARREGVFNGIWASGQKMAYSLAPGIVGVTLELCGFLPSLAEGQSQPAGAALGIRLVFCIVPAVALVASLLILRRYELTEERFAEVRATLRKNAA